MSKFLYKKNLTIFVPNLKTTQMKNLKPALPTGKVPRDFPNWMKKIHSNFLNELGIRSYNVINAESFKDRQPVRYRESETVMIDENGNRVKYVSVNRIF